MLPCAVARHSSARRWLPGWLWEIARQSGRPMEHRLPSLCSVRTTERRFPSCHRSFWMCTKIRKFQPWGENSRHEPSVNVQTSTVGGLCFYRVAFGVSFVCPLILRPRRSVLGQAAFG